MKIIVCSRREILEMKHPDELHAIISINDPDGSTPLKGINAKILILHFDDTVSATSWEESSAYDIYNRDCVLFDPYHARQIFDFFDKVKDLDTMIIHCAAGHSRSAAVASFLAQIIGQDNGEFYRMPRCPNVLIRNIMRNVWFERSGILIA